MEQHIAQKTNSWYEECKVLFLWTQCMVSPQIPNQCSRGNNPSALQELFSSPQCASVLHYQFCLLQLRAEVQLYWSLIIDFYRILVLLMCLDLSFLSNNSQAICVYLQVKRVMNGVFHSLRAEFDLSESYSGQAVLGVIVSTIKVG